MSNKRRNAATFPIKGNMMEVPFEVQFIRHSRLLRLNQCSNSSTEGIGCLSLTMVSFERGMSTQALMSPSDFGKMVNGDIQNVGPSSTSLIISAAKSSSNFVSTFSRS